MASFKNALEGMELQKVAKESFLDLWVCHHFKVLPTESRFLRLSESQKNLLFVGYLENPTSEQMHEAHNATALVPITDEDAESFKRLGYSEEQIANMKTNLEAASRG